MPRISTEDYLSGSETLRRRELVWGVVREPPAPFYSHQRIVTDLAVVLHRHVTQHNLGEICVSPIDVVLDASADLVVQPDLVFISRERLGIVRNQIWGAPDLAIEVVSPGSSTYDGRRKLSWYRRYAIREYWIVYPKSERVIVHDLTRRGKQATFKAGAALRSTVLPEFSLPVREIFASAYTKSLPLTGTTDRLDRDRRLERRGRRHTRGVRR
jgi:Uma2 family endonuclease